MTQAEVRAYQPVGWEGLDAMLAAVQREHPLAVEALTAIRGELAAMRFALGLEPEQDARIDGMLMMIPHRDPKQRQSVRDALTFAPSTEHAAHAVITQSDARAFGFTGSFCPDCGGTHMVRSGTCEHCTECGATTGCS